MKKQFHLVWLVFFISMSGFAQTKSTGEYIANGNQWYDKGKYQQAIEQYHNALQIDSNCNEARNEMASAYYALKDYSHALEQSTILLKSKSKYREDAYIVNANSLDMLNRRLEAISILKAGIKEYPNNYLLYYHLGVYYSRNKNFKLSQEALEKGLALKPSHPNTNALLGYVLNEQGKHVKSLLCLYNYLLLDPIGNRAKFSITAIDSQFQKSKNIPAIKDGTQPLPTGFEHVELLLAKLRSPEVLLENKNKPWQDVFIHNSTIFLTGLKDVKPSGKDDIWTSYYTPYFSALIANKHAEAFCYYVCQIKETAAIITWLNTHKDKVEAFLKWNADYNR